MSNRWINGTESNRGWISEGTFAYGAPDVHPYQPNVAPFTQSIATVSSLTIEEMRQKIGEVLAKIDEVLEEQSRLVLAIPVWDESHPMEEVAGGD